MGICYGDLNGEKIVGTFYEKNTKNKSKRVQSLKKQSTENMIDYKLNGNNSFNRWTDTKSI